MHMIAAAKQIGRIGRGPAVLCYGVTAGSALRAVAVGLEWPPEWSKA